MNTISNVSNSITNIQGDSHYCAFGGQDIWAVVVKLCSCADALSLISADKFTRSLMIAKAVNLKTNVCLLFKVFTTALQSQYEATYDPNNNPAIDIQNTGRYAHAGLQIKEGCIGEITVKTCDNKLCPINDSEIFVSLDFYKFNRSIFSNRPDQSNYNPNYVEFYDKLPIKRISTRINGIDPYIAHAIKLAEMMANKIHFENNASFFERLTEWYRSSF